MPKTKKSRGSKSVGTASQEKDKEADAKSRKLDIRGGAGTKTHTPDVQWFDAGKYKNDDGSRESKPLKGTALAAKIARARDSYVAPVTFPKAPPDKTPKQSGKQAAPEVFRSSNVAAYRADKKAKDNQPNIPSGNTSGIDVAKDREDAKKTIAQMHADQPAPKKHDFISDYTNRQKSIAGDIKAKELTHGLRQMAITQKAKDDPKFDIARAAKSDAQLRAPDVRDAIRKYRQVSKDVSKFSSPDHFSKKYATPEDREHLDKVNKETLSTVKSFAGVKTKAEVDAERDEDRGKRAREGDLSPSKKQYLRVPSDKALTSMDQKAKASKNLDWSADDHPERTSKKDMGYDVSLDHPTKKALASLIGTHSDRHGPESNLIRSLIRTPDRNDAQGRAYSDKVDKAILAKQAAAAKLQTPSTPKAPKDSVVHTTSFTKLASDPRVGKAFHDMANREAEKTTADNATRAKSAKIRSTAMSAASVWRGGQIRAKQQKNWKPVDKTPQATDQAAKRAKAAKDHDDAMRAGSEWGRVQKDKPN